MNAVNFAMAELMESFVNDFEQDDNLWCGIICSSNSRSFCSGADLKGISEGILPFTEKGHFFGFTGYPRTKPVIAAVDGFALAGGCEIVAACDFIVAGEQSKFGLPEVKRSLTAAAGGMFRLE
jgi:enoyl-CoA hydratase